MKSFDVFLCKQCMLAFPIPLTQWVINKKFDVIFFIGSSVLGIAYFFLLLLIPQYSLLITAVVWVVFAQAHFGSTWFIYFDKKNRAYFREHPIIYYLNPLLIFVTVLVLGYINQVLLATIISVVSVYHVTKQSMGILQIYRVRNKEFELSGRQAENAVIALWTLFFVAVGSLYLPVFRNMFGVFLPFAKIGAYVLFGAAVCATMIVIAQYRKRQQNSLPKTLFFLNATLMYSPYIYAAVILVDIYQMEIATLTSLITHYMQYMGLVWLINRNKYGGTTTYAEENRILHLISKKYWYIAGAIFAYALLMAFLRWGVPIFRYELLTRTLPNIVLALTAIHFYIDAFIWRFRNPFYRETVLPFVKPVESSIAGV